MLGIKLKTLIYGTLAINLISTSMVPSYSAAAELEEVIVTAQRREQGLLDTPIAVTALTAKALENRNISNISEIANFTPNLVFDTTAPISGLSSGAVIFIRGIGNTDFSLTTDPGVGTYVDGIYMSRSAGGVLDVLDVERIEVLRGPQGTLFGRNTIGGAVNITSRKPADIMQGNLNATFGNFNRQNIRATIDLPLSDSIRSSFAVSSKVADGYVKRVLDDRYLGDEERLSFRANMILEPTESLVFFLSYDRSKINEESAASSVVAFTPGAGTIGYGLATFGSIQQGLDDLAQYVTQGDDDLSFGTGVSGTRLTIEGLSLISAYHGESFTLKHFFSIRETEGEFFSDPDNAPHNITNILNPDYEHEQLSHELQVTGNAFENRLSYVVGLTYFDEQGTDNVFVPVFLPTPDLSAGFPAAISNFAQVDNTSKAVYMQFGWQLFDNTSLTVGLRHTRDEKSFTYTQYIGADIQGNPLPFFPGAVNQFGVFTPGLLPLVGNGSGTSDQSFKQTSYKLGAETYLPDGSLLYYSFSQGYKSGGYGLRYVEAVSEVRVFDPETLDTHEIGIKWQNSDNRIRLTAALFYSDYDEVQVTLFDSLGGPVTANAGDVKIKGLEIELSALLSDQISLDLGYGYIDAKYKTINAIPGLSLTINDSAKLVNTPKQSFNLGIEYKLKLLDMPLSLRIDYAFTDDIYNDSQNSIFLFAESNHQLNLSGRLNINDNVELTLFGQNLTDERYVTSGNSNFGLGFHEANFNKPRQYGITFRYSF